MRKIQVWAEMSDEAFHRYECEAQRQQVDVGVLVEQTVNCLLKELEREESDGPQFIMPA